MTLDIVIIKFEWGKKTNQILLWDATMVTLSLLACPFITNSPTTFQSCINNIYQKQICNFVWVFFDDILVYSKTWKEHLHHLEEVLKIPHGQTLFTNMSKYEFGLTEVLYLGHIICRYGVKVDMEKIRAILECPRPKNLTELRGFIRIRDNFKGEI